MARDSNAYTQGSPWHSGKTSGLALPLLVVYCGLVIYASLYPFANWQGRGVMPWLFLMNPLPRYWSGLDVSINILGYMPLGLLLAIVWRGDIYAPRRHRVWFAMVCAGALSLVMEALQTYLPQRDASNVDWALNTLGGLIGGVLAYLLDRLGLLVQWRELRQQNFVNNAGVALGLLLLWPLALLYPTAVALGLGYDWSAWVKLDMHRLSSQTEWLIAALGLCIPVGLGCAVIPKLRHRIVLLLCVFACAIGVSSLSNGLSFGATHALVWLSPQVMQGLFVGAGVALLLLFFTRHTCWVLLPFLLILQLFLLSARAQDPYFTQTLELWQRGPWMRFYGAMQWLGWLWPYAVLVLALFHLMRPRRQN